MKVLKITGPDINNGLGNRITVWFAGCNHHCDMCQNSWTWNYNQGYDIEDAYEKINNVLGLDYIQGITFSGGDPLQQTETSLQELLKMIMYIRKNFAGKDIWIYTGYTLQELKERNNGTLNGILDNIDVLVDGMFDNELKDLSLAFRGSSNQNIWDMKNNVLLSLD